MPATFRERGDADSQQLNETAAIFSTHSSGTIAIELSSAGAQVMWERGPENKTWKKIAPK